ncbi:hypothetical protein V8C86DRAFT_1814530 [Haematococcus lacustris]
MLDPLDDANLSLGGQEEFGDAMLLLPEGTLEDEDPGLGLLPLVPLARSSRGGRNRRRPGPDGGPPTSICLKPAPNPYGQACTACDTLTTPVWRAGPHGPSTLCNACGLRYAKVAKKVTDCPRKGRQVVSEARVGGQKSKADFAHRRK